MDAERAAERALLVQDGGVPFAGRGFQGTEGHCFCCLPLRLFSARGCDGEMSFLTFLLWKLRLDRIRTYT